MVELEDKELTRKLDELRQEFEDSTETISDGDSPVWVIDQAIERIGQPEPSRYRLFDQVEHEIIATVLVKDGTSDQRFYELKDIYRADHENYSVDGFIEFLNEKGVEAEKTEPSEVNF